MPIMILEEQREIILPRCHSWHAGTVTRFCERDRLMESGYASIIFQTGFEDYHPEERIVKTRVAQPLKR